MKISSDIIDPAVFKLPVNSHAIISVSVDANIRQDIVFKKEFKPGVIRIMPVPSEKSIDKHGAILINLFI